MIAIESGGTLMAEISTVEWRRHHRRARKASIEDYEALGADHAREDALATFAGTTLFDPEVVKTLQQQRMADRTRRFHEAGVSPDRINAWQASHKTSFAERIAELEGRSR